MGFFNKLFRKEKKTEVLVQEQVNQGKIYLDQNTADEIETILKDLQNKK